MIDAKMADKRIRESASEENAVDVKYRRLSLLSFDQIVEVMKYERLENFADLFKKGLIENINAMNDMGYTFLMIACDGGSVGCVKLLIENGANINLLSHDMQSALTKACHKKQLEIIKLLLISGVDLQEDDGLNHRPLVVACEQGDIDAAELCLMRGLDINCRSNGDVLIESYRSKQMNIVAWLLEHSYEIHYVDDEYPDDNPLVRACDEGWTYLVQILLNQGADVNVSAGTYHRNNQDYDDVDGLASFPLLAASRQGHAKTVRLLIERGADISLNDGSALVIAAQNGHLDAMRFFLSSGAGASIGKDESLVRAAL